MFYLALHPQQAAPRSCPVKRVGHQAHFLTTMCRRSQSIPTASPLRTPLCSEHGRVILLALVLGGPWALPSVEQLVGGISQGNQHSS